MKRENALNWNKLLLAAAVLLVLGALAAFATGGGFALAEPTETPAMNWGELPEETPVPTPEPNWAPAADASAAPAQQTRSLYEAVVAIDARAGLIEGKLRLTYVNTSADMLYEIKLRLYPNDVSPGCMALGLVAVNGERSYYKLSGENGSFLSVPLPVEIGANGTAEIFLTFTIDIPDTGSRFGENENGIMLGNFLPIAAVYENGAWREDAYSPVGDAFYSEIADYRIAVTAPRDYAIAHTGSLLGQEAEIGAYTYYIHAPQTRDFALALVPDAKVALAETSIGRTAVHCLGTTNAAAEFGAAAAVRALEFLNQRIGYYPYPDLSVVPFDQGGGMEYPGLVMISDRYFRSSERQRMGELVISHEVAHQWFYAVVGTDQINTPWLDESLVEFLGFLCYENANGAEAAQALWQTRFADYGTVARTLPLDATLYEFAAAEGNEYFQTVYAHGAAFYRALYEEVGASAFFQALRLFYDANSFQNAGRGELLLAFEETTGRDLSAWFDARMAVDYVFSPAEAAQ